MMNTRRIHSVMAVALAGLIAGAPSARASLIDNLAIGLDAGGFNVAGANNPLSGGVDFTVSNTFFGNTLDFGAWDLTIQGPVTLQVSTGGRLLPQFDASFQFGLLGDGTRNNPGYIYRYDVGAQSVEVWGSILVDADLSVNALGWYDLEFTYSSRQTVERDGFVTDTQQFDGDLGPVSISGNIVADALYVLTDALFRQSGQENPFAQLSGLAQLQSGVAASKVADAVAPFSFDPLSDLTLDGSFQAARVPHSLGPLSEPLVAGTPTNGAFGSTVAAVPEPVTGLLALMALAVVGRRSRKRATG